MASIFTLPPLEEGGPIARGGFLYQDNVAVALCLEMLSNSELQAIHCETQDDLVLNRKVKGNVVAEFVQVKSDALNQLWSPAKLYARDTLQNKPVVGTSIIEKQLARDRGDEPVSFRLVTLRDVNAELRCLKKPHAQRDSEDLKEQNELVVSLTQHLGNCVSPNGRGLDYWANHMLCDVRESLQALEQSNLVTLQEYLNTELKLPCLMAQTRGVYADLVEEMRRCAEARWSFGPERKRIGRDDLIAWIKKRATSISPAFAPEPVQELLSLERASIARCETRWLALGIPNDLASSLANDQTIGAPSAQLASLLERRFVWLTGDFGSGKSLVVERIFQQRLLLFRNDSNARIPVFLEAKTLAGRSLREELELRAKRFGEIATKGVVLILDGIDEAGTTAALSLLNEAHVLSRTWQNVTIIITSIDFSGHGFKEHRVPLPPIDEPTAVNLVQRIAGQPIQSIHQLPQCLHKDIGNPLFAVLLGLHMRNNSQNLAFPSSTGELIAEVAHRALHPLLKSYENAHDLLVRLAAFSTDAGGAPVHFSVVASSIHKIQPLIETRLVSENNGLISFTVSTLAHWFAAEALRLGIVKTEELASLVGRAERWRFPLAVFAGTSSFADASLAIEPFARNQPGFASIMLRDAVRDRYFQSKDTPPSAQILGEQIYRCMLAWMEGLGPLAKAVLPVNSKGELNKLRVHLDGNRVTCGWTEDHNARAIQAVEKISTDGFGSGEIWSFGVNDQQSWAWLRTQSNIQGKLRRLLEARKLSLAAPAMVKELIWSEACERTVKSRFSDQSIPLSALINSRPRSLSSGAAEQFFRIEVQKIYDAGQESLIAPYPQADQEPATPWIDDYFSSQRKLERATAVYQTALIAYEQVVRKWFPKFASRLKHFVLLPARVVGVVATDSSAGQPNGWPFACRFEPLAKGEQSRVEFRLGTAAEGLEFFRTIQSSQELISRLRPDATEWLYPDGFASGLEDICQADPCTRIVYRWLTDDLKEVKWIQ